MNRRELAMQVLKHISTGANGIDYDMGRIVGLVSISMYGVMGMLYLIYCIQNALTFDFMNYGTGYAAFAGGTGALIWAKQDTEPKP